jgi:hypothetical protein
MRWILVSKWGAPLLAAVLVATAPAQDLGVAERFGPDGLPFSHDDPLAVGASASKVRYGAMAGDACSEDHAHPHPSGGGTQIQAPLTDHPARPSVNDYGSFPAPNFVLEAPFDLTMWVAGVNLTDGRVGRFRIFPEDPAGWLEDLDYTADERGWVQSNSGAVPGWTSHTDPDLGALMDGNVTESDAGAGDRDMGNVFSGGPIKELHLETLGLAYRDIKNSNPTQHDLPIAIKQETLETMTEFWDKMGNKVNELHLTCQQAYIEAWVSELMNLGGTTPFASGISGNFVLDLTGEHIIQRVDYEKEKSGCKVKFEDLPFDLGGPVVHNLGAYNKIVDYFLAERWDYLWSYKEMENTGILPACEIGALLVDIEGIAKEKVKEKLAPMDLAAELFEDEGLDASSGGAGGTHIRGGTTTEGLSASSSLYEIIAAYSGLAGQGSKNVFDKFALSVMIFFAQFKPTEWSPWSYVDASEAMMGFEPDGALLTTQQTMGGGDDFRYNQGSSYIGKAMWIYGNSKGQDGNGIGDKNPGGNQATHRLGDNNAAHDLNLNDSPDILKSFAMKWLHVRIDVVDPYLYEESRMAASWKDKDILVDHASTEGELLVDWPPPNYGFGRAQVVSFRAASGGEPSTPMGLAADVDTSTTQIWQGLVSIDPLTATYSVLGSMSKIAETPYLDFSAGVQKYPGDGLFTWSEPRALGPAGTDPQVPGYFDQSTPYRWLTGGANHWREANTVLRWGWDFDTSDGAEIDSEHLQQMADIQGSTYGALFGVQTQADGGAKGRTGFSLVDMELPLNPP